MVGSDLDFDYASGTFTGDKGHRQMRVNGKVSWFGGPDDEGVAPDEGLAFIFEVEDAPHLFLPAQPPGTTGLARRLNPDKFYIAMRWDYDRPNESKSELLKHTALVRAPKTGKQFECWPADWGPNANTNRIADLSPALMTALGIITDDEVEVTYPYRAADQEEGDVEYSSIVISSGHSSKCPGASGILDEVTEARRVVDRLVEEFKKRGCKVESFHDDVSTTVSQNLDRIVDYHNARERELDLSVHFNAYVETPKPMGCEVLYKTQAELATRVSAAIAECGFIDRGGKHRTDLAFLNGTAMPAVLLEICFVDSVADADMYEATFDRICEEIADELCGEYQGEEEGGGDRPPRPPRPERPPAVPHVDIMVSGDVLVTINGVPVTS